MSGIYTVERSPRTAAARNAGAGARVAFEYQAESASDAISQAVEDCTWRDPRDNFNWRVVARRPATASEEIVVHMTHLASGSPALGVGCVWCEAWLRSLEVAAGLVNDPGVTERSTNMSDGQAIWNGCDETADCPAEVHSSRCWQGVSEARGSES